MNTPEKKITFSLWNMSNATVLRCAVLYALGRQSYAAELTTKEISPLLPYLPPHCLHMMEQDIVKQLPDIHEKDRPTWNMFLTDVRAAILKWKEGRSAPPRPAIDLKGNFFGFILGSAVRYSLKQDNSYAENTVFCITRILPAMGLMALKNMRSDLISCEECVTNKADVVLWKKFLAELENEIKKRGASL